MLSIQMEDKPAAPEGTPPRRINDHKFSRYFTDPPCLGEALRRVTIIIIIFQRKGKVLSFLVLDWIKR